MNKAILIILIIAIIFLPIGFYIGASAYLHLLTLLGMILGFILAMTYAYWWIFKKEE
jgi:uncharacterized membrane protein YqaE (UPF0057 family)